MGQSYLIRTGIAGKGSTVALADSPAGNDVGLTEYHNSGIPFISVASSATKCPLHLRSCHAGDNERGSGAVVSQLVEIKRRGFGTGNELTVGAVEQLVARARGELYFGLGAAEKMVVLSIDAALLGVRSAIATTAIAGSP